MAIDKYKQGFTDALAYMGFTESHIIYVYNKCVAANPPAQPESAGFPTTTAMPGQEPANAGAGLDNKEARLYENTKERSK